jgi:transcriptional regulator with XRE-family HTH domain
MNKGKSRTALEGRAVFRFRGDRLRDERKTRGWTLDNLAGLLENMEDGSQISRWERVKTLPPLGRIAELCKIFEKERSYFCEEVIDTNYTYREAASGLPSASDFLFEANDTTGVVAGVWEVLVPKDNKSEKFTRSIALVSPYSQTNTDFVTILIDEGGCWQGTCTLRDSFFYCWWKTYSDIIFVTGYLNLNVGRFQYIGNMVRNNFNRDGITLTSCFAQKSSIRDFCGFQPLELDVVTRLARSIQNAFAGTKMPKEDLLLFKRACTDVNGADVASQFQGILYQGEDDAHELSCTGRSASTGYKEFGFHVLDIDWPNIKHFREF